MYIAFIGCMAMSREVSREVSESKHCIRTWWLKQGLHDTPDLLRKNLQEQIDLVEEESRGQDRYHQFQYICLGYGLCSNGIVGIHSKEIPLIIPRCDDCISLFLGSAERYRKLFSQYDGGAFWYTNGWIEQAVTPSVLSYKRLYESYVKRFGEENAKFLLDSRNDWMKNYHHCVYIEDPEWQCRENVQYTKQAAKDFSWKYHFEKGDNSYFHSLINGPWDEKCFLICPPGKVVEADYSTLKIKA